MLRPILKARREKAKGISHRDLKIDSAQQTLDQNLTLPLQIQRLERDVIVIFFALG